MFYSFNYHSSVFWLKEKEIFGTKDRTITVILSENDSKFSKNCSREDLFPGRSDDAAWGPRSPRSFSRSPRCRFPEQAKITGLTPTCNAVKTCWKAWFHYFRSRVRLYRICSQYNNTNGNNFIQDKFGQPVLHICICTICSKKISWSTLPLEL